MQSSLSSSIEVQGANHEMYSKVRIAKIKCDMFNIGRQKAFSHAGENAAKVQSPEKLEPMA